jgi:flagellar biosynthesis/type III secretory pathway M-ring protein FliF/YscJ
MTTRVPRRLHRGVAWIAAVTMVLLPTSAALASTGTDSGDERAAAAQAVLDRVLGPGNSVVTVSDTVRTSTSTTSSVVWGSGVAGATATSLTTSGSGSTTHVDQQNLVGGTDTVTVTPPGALVRQSVSVVVDRNHLGAMRLSSIRHLVAAAVGLTPARGDRLRVAAAAFAAARPPAAPPAPSPFAVVLPFATPVLWGLGGVVALAILGASFGGRRRARPAARS